MHNFEIPPLTEFQREKVDRILQVQALIRHGARAPYAKFSCWKDYNISWSSCNVTEIVSPMSDWHEKNRYSLLQFRKLYDGSPNILGGNCGIGHLLSEGYVQSKWNGVHLRSRYWGDGIDSNDSSRLSLFDSILNDDISQKIYLRSDDESRTLMSGQIAAQYLFNTTTPFTVNWHTGDYSYDQIYPNEKKCEKLKYIRSMAYSSPEWISYNNSDYVISLTAKLTEIFGDGYWSWYYALDCIMTTVCSGQQLPHNPSMTEHLFNETLNHIEKTFAFLALYNDSSWSKLSMYHFANEIQSKLIQAIQNDIFDNKYIKFALYGNALILLISYF